MNVLCTVFYKSDVFLGRLILVYRHAFEDSLPILSISLLAEVCLLHCCIIMSVNPPLYCCQISYDKSGCFLKLVTFWFVLCDLHVNYYADKEKQ